MTAIIVCLNPVGRGSSFRQSSSIMMIVIIVVHFEIIIGNDSLQDLQVFEFDAHNFGRLLQIDRSSVVIIVVIMMIMTVVAVVVVLRRRSPQHQIK